MLLGKHFYNITVVDSEQLVKQPEFLTLSQQSRKLRCRERTRNELGNGERYPLHIKEGLG